MFSVTITAIIDVALLDCRLPRSEPFDEIPRHASFVLMIPDKMVVITIDLTLT